MHALEAFEVAARHLSFLKAADELCVSQSAVSHRIRQLEDDLGVRLFLRINRHIVLTPTGETYLAAIRRVLADLEGATRSIARGVRRTLKVSVAPAIGSKWLVGRLTDFQRLHPDIDLVVSVSIQTAVIKSGEVDVGIRYGHGQWPGLSACKLFDEVLVAVCQPAYARRIGGLTRPADLAQATLLRHPSLPWKPWLEAAGLDWPEPAGGVLFDDALMMIEAAATGGGVAICPRRFVAPYLEAGSLVLLCGLVVPGRSYYLLSAPAVTDKPWVTAFAEWLVAAARISEA